MGRGLRVEEEWGQNKINLVKAHRFNFDINFQYNQISYIGKKKIGDPGDEVPSFKKS